MNKHWQYAQYLWRHKKEVYRAGVRLKVPRWRLIIHDWTKLLPSEWFPYANYFYGKKDEKAFDLAWLHHQHHNPHHWQHWLLQMDSGELIRLDMPETYIREMLADWIGASMALGYGQNVLDWYLDREEGILLSIRTRQFLGWLMKKEMDW